MRIKEIKIYQYDELSDNAKEKARDWFREASGSDEWWESVYEDAENIGLKITGFDIDRGHYCKGQFINGAVATAHAIENDHGDTCETFKTAKAFLAERDKAVNEAPRDENGEFESERDLDEKLDEIESEFLKSLLEDYRINLSKEYEYQNSDEVVIENIRANEYEFDENGKRV